MCLSRQQVHSTQFKNNKIKILENDFLSVSRQLNAVNCIPWCLMKRLTEQLISNLNNPSGNKFIMNFRRFK